MPRFGENARDIFPAFIRRGAGSSRSSVSSVYLVEDTAYLAFASGCGFGK
jgi:hypothetical protein